MVYDTHFFLMSSKKKNIVLLFSVFVFFFFFQENVVDESGWKQIHGDVFRAPANLEVFAALVGTGWQLYSFSLGVIVVAISSSVYDS